jgi:predicted esterase
MRSPHRRVAAAVAGVAILGLLVLLAVPSVGLIGSGSGTGIATAVSKEEVDAAIAAAEQASPAQSVAAATTSAEPPYSVGTVTVTLIDVTRSTPARGSVPASSTRSMTVTISYPITDTGERFPLVVFAHGYNASASTYSAMEREVAAAGFIVAAPDFPLSSSALDGEPVRDIVDQANDVSFVITSLLDPSSRPAELLGLVANTQVGLIGHSDGAVTAAGVAYNDQYADSRIGAAVILSGAEAFFPGSWFSTSSPALLAVHGTADEVNPFGASQTLFAGATGAKWLVGVTGGSHLAPFTTDAVRPEISVLVADFLRAELSGDAAASARIATDATASGLALVAQG